MDYILLLCRSTELNNYYKIHHVRTTESHSEWLPTQNTPPIAEIEYLAFKVEIKCNNQEHSL